MAQTFNYTIDEFDPLTKRVQVTFDDGGWALIDLAEPLPRNAQELDMVVRNYTASVERMAGRHSSVDTGFIADMVGQSRAANRYSARASIDGDPQTVVAPVVPRTLEDYKLVAKEKIAAVRYAREIAGLPLDGGRVFPTDRETQAKLTAKFVAIMAAQQAAAGGQGDDDPAKQALAALAKSLGAINWKLGDGSFITLDMAGFMTIAIQAAGYVQGVFDWEKGKLEELDLLTDISDVSAFADKLGAP